MHPPAHRWIVIGFLAFSCGSRGPQVETLPKKAAPPPAGSPLLGPSAFDSLPNERDRSRALFTEMYQVLSHPRCANCHPSGSSPLQGMDGRIHDPPVSRGVADQRVVGMTCSTCHQDHNLEFARVPGAPSWHLAPIEMAWVGKSASQLCQQIKDPRRNGGKSLLQIQEHLAHDPLVAWGWNPGHGREPAPGTQAQLGLLAEAWISTGAQCPKETR